MLLTVDDEMAMEIVRLADRKGWSISDTITDMLLAYAGCDNKTQFIQYIRYGVLP